MSLTIAYLINQYHSVSHSFIRREITGVEACGIRVRRFSIRSCSTHLVEEADKLEMDRTRVVLGIGMVGLLFSLLRVAVTRPVRFLQVWLTLRLGWRSERGVLLYLAYLAETCVLRRWFSDSSVAHVHAHFGTNSTTVAFLAGPPIAVPAQPRLGLQEHVEAIGWASTSERQHILASRAIVSDLEQEFFEVKRVRL